MSSDWQSLRRFEETNLHVLQTEMLSDVTFLAGENKKEVKAHKVILASRSPVFYNMFCGSLAEPTDLIEIPDIEEDILKDLLRFLYTEDCDIRSESVMALLYAAKKYELHRLQEKCMTFLKDGMSPENVCLILQHADVFGEKELIKKCFDFIFTNSDAVLKSGGIACLSKDVFSKLLESDYFYANEVDIYEACKLWATEQLKQKRETMSHSTIRRELCKLLFLIRFPIMAPDVFANRISREDILSSEEKVSIFRSFHSRLSVPGSDLLFSKLPRYSKNIRITVSRFKASDQVTSYWINAGTLYGIKFKLSKSAAFAGVSMFSPCIDGYITGSVSLLDGEDVLITSEIRIDFQDNCQFKDIVFNEIIMLQADKVYAVHQRMKGVNSYLGAKGKQICTDDRLGLNVEFSNCDRECGSATNINQGQIRGLIFYAPFLQT